ncbi:MAG: rod shape-determining protein RodA [Motilibacteraceae bacterium]
MSAGGYPAAVRSRGAQASGRSRESVWPRLDWVLVGTVLAMCVVGSLLVWSATRGRMIDAGGDPQSFVKKNVLNIVIGLGLGLATTFFDYRMLRAYAPVIYVASILGLLAVLSPLGSTINGAHSWIVLPAGFSVQPAEFAKVALVVGMAVLLSEKRDAEDTPRDVDVMLALAFAAVPLGLIMLQPDLGTSLVICCLLLGVIAVSGAKARWVGGLVLAGVLLGFVAVQAGVIHEYQIKRLTSFVDPNADPSGSGYNVRQAQIAIGSGGVDGQGLFHGYQTQGKFVPEQQTDFVFTVAGEELGLVGAGGIIALLGLLLWRALRIAARAEDLFGRLVAVGIVCWFTFQAFENIGMTLGLMPVTGVPLPFVSYGGSSMFANFMAVGLLENVHLRRYA